MKTYGITFLIFILIPTLIAAVLFLIFENKNLIELSYFIFGIIELILLIGRANRNDRLNMQEYGTTKMDKTTDVYKEYKKLQWVLLSSAILNFMLAYLSFMVFGAIS